MIESREEDEETHLERIGERERESPMTPGARRERGEDHITTTTTKEEHFVVEDLLLLNSIITHKRGKN